MVDVADSIIVPVYNGEHIDAHTKSNETPFTIADTNSEIELKKRFRDIYPSVIFIAEESEGENDGKGWRALECLKRENSLFVPDRSMLVMPIDPLDGTINFQLGRSGGQPFGMMVGLFENGVMKAVWSYYPLLREFLFASQEMATCRIRVQSDGSFGDPEILRFSERSAQDLSLHFFLLGHHKDPDEHLAKGRELFKGVQSAVAHIKSSFCAATSTYDMLVHQTVGVVTSPLYTTPWDFWTLGYLVERMGGGALSSEGRPNMSCDAFGTVLARSPALARRVCEVMRANNLTRLRAAQC